MDTMSHVILFGVPGPWQIVLIVVMIVLLFGGRKIPELMRGLGQGMKEFKDATREDDGKNGGSKAPESTSTPPGESK